ncbi:MAG: hypothetical protein ACRYGR_07170, partial [Janthinobacterium lividum]
CAAQRLTTPFITRSEKFVEDMRDYGHTYAFVPGDHEDLAADNRVIAGPSDSSKSTSRTKDSTSHAVRVEPTTSAEVEKVLPPQATVSLPIKDNSLAWIETKHVETRDFDLGTIQQAVYKSCFGEQSTKWDDISLGYVADCVRITHTFIMALLDSTCHETRVRDGLKAILLPRITEAYLKAVDTAERLLDAIHSETPWSPFLNFSNSLKKR